MNQDDGRRAAATLPLYLTNDHPCSYLGDKQARTLFVDPLARIDGDRYGDLLQHGFRRSGTHVYRPACRHCQRCIPVRLPVETFRADRSQRRNLRLNRQAVQIIKRPAMLDAEHYRLYADYVRSRHPDGSMAEEISVDSYYRFLVEPWGGESLFLELRLDGRLLAVAVTDVVPDGLSAVYTFFDPARADRAPGTFGVLSQIDCARRRGLDYLYLGYWIKESHKMRYKDRFRPIEAWNGHQWQSFGKGEPIQFPNI